MFSVANTSRQVLNVAEALGCSFGIPIFKLCLLTKSRNTFVVGFFVLFFLFVCLFGFFFPHKNCGSRLPQGSRGWVFKSTYSTSGVKSAQDKLPCVKLSPVVAVKPIRGCKKQSHCIEIVLSCSQ